MPLFNFLIVYKILIRCFLTLASIRSCEWKHRVIFSVTSITEVSPTSFFINDKLCKHLVLNGTEFMFRQYLRGIVILTCW
jgi:hypothetical protein